MARAAQLVEQRFWSRVNKTDTCWLWTAGKTKGYGTISVNGSPRYAHQLSWLWANGQETLPHGEGVLHKCDVPACVNPAHLFTGTQAVNNWDKIIKGRNNPGRTQKVTPEAVEEIRQLYATGDYRQKDLALQFGVTRRQIGNITYGRRRARAKGPTGRLDRRLVTEKEKAEMQELRLLGLGQQEIADRFGVGQSHVSRILANKTRRTKKPA